MKNIGLKVEDLEQFFEDLFNQCKRQDCYSVRETVERMGMFYHKVKEWAMTNENWSYLLELCHIHCEYHIEEAYLQGDLSEQDTMKYRCENTS